MNVTDVHSGEMSAHSVCRDVLPLSCLALATEPEHDSRLLSYSAPKSFLSLHPEACFTSIVNIERGGESRGSSTEMGIADGIRGDCIAHETKQRGGHQERFTIP